MIYKLKFNPFYLEMSYIFTIFIEKLRYTILLEKITLHNIHKQFPDEETCMDYLESILWKDGVVSPFDPTSKVYKLKTPHVYRCRNTGKNFTVRHGTIFHDSKIPLIKWFKAIHLLNTRKKGISSLQLAEDINVTQKTAWRMLHIIRECYGFANQGILKGIVELDETFVGGKNKNRHWDKKVKNSRGRSFKDKTPVFGMLERGGKLICRVVENTKSKALMPHILEHVDKSAILYTDEWGGYNVAGKKYTRHYVDHGKGQYVNGAVHTNTIEGAWSHFKRSIIGVYHYTSRKHLQRYANEFVFHYVYRKYTGKEKFDLFIHNAKYRLSHEQLAA